MWGVSIIPLSLLVGISDVQWVFIFSPEKPSETISSHCLWTFPQVPGWSYSQPAELTNFLENSVLPKTYLSHELLLRVSSKDTYQLKARTDAWTLDKSVRRTTPSITGMSLLNSTCRATISPAPRPHSSPTLRHTHKGSFGTMLHLKCSVTITC